MIMNDTNEIGWNDHGQIEVLTFEMQHESFAVEAASVREIIDPQPETRVPGSAPLISSVINFRGHIIPIADLRLAFGLPAAAATSASRVIVLEYPIDGESCLLGIKADKVHEVATLERERTEAVPRIGVKWRHDFVCGMAKRAGQLTIVPNLSNILAACSQPSATFCNPPSIHPGY
jgi:purine-binding chemotaxis protein CheW